MFVKHHISLIYPLFFLLFLHFPQPFIFTFLTLHPSRPSIFTPTVCIFFSTCTSSIHPVYCITSPAKDERYRAPPPTPPGYQGLALGDLGLTDGVGGGPGGSLPPRPPHLRPPDYSVALQRSKLMQSPGAAGSLAEARRLAGNPHLQQSQGPSRPPSICLPPQGLADSEDGTYLVF